MEFNKYKQLAETDKKEIFSLWNREYPQQLNYPSLTEFEKYIDACSHPTHIVSRNGNQKIQGWYFDFIRDNARWFMLIVDSEIQGKGIGTRMLDLAREDVDELNGWVIDHDDYQRKIGKIYKSPLYFYLRSGFDQLSEERLNTDKISAVRILWKKQKVVGI